MNSTNGNDTVPVALRIGDSDVILRRKKVPVDSLKLDVTNPRLSYQLTEFRKEGKLATDEELHEVLWNMDPVKDLYQSILQNGGLIFDPYIKEDGTVVEGNCRTVCLRELQKKFPKDPRFNEVYVQVLPEKFSEEQLVTLLGELHIAGKIEWRAYEQAEYVFRMHKEYGKTYDYLASHLRWSRSKIAQKIGAYEETKTYIAETQDPDGVNRFSHFEEFMKKKELRDRRETDPSFMKDFRKWVFEGKFPDAKDVRKFPDVLTNDRSFEEFGRRDIRAAEMVLVASDPSRSSDFYWSIDRTTEQLLNTPLAEINELKSGNLAKLDKIRTLYKAIKDVAATAGIKLD